MSIHVEEKGKIRCVSPDRTLVEVLKQKFESKVDEIVPMVQETELKEQSFTGEEIILETPIKETIPFIPSPCLKENLKKLNSTV